MTTDFTKPIEERLRRLAEATLQAAGAESAKEMKRFLEGDNGDDTGRLKDSISYATKEFSPIAAGPDVKDSDLVDKPTADYTVVIGTVVPYAKYVNYGALPHGRGTEGAAEEQEGTFISKIMTWAERQPWYDNTPEARGRAYAIANAIRENGTDAIPFFEPALPKIQEIAKAIGPSIAKELGQNLEPVTIVIDPDGRMKRNTKAQESSNNLRLGKLLGGF